MKRTVPQWTIAIALAAGYALTAAGQVQIHPPGGALGGPIRIAVLSDHYQSGEEAQFNNHVNNLVLAELLNSPDFDDYVGDLTIVRHFVPWSPSPTTSYSSFGFELGTGSGHCSIAWNESSTTDLVEGAVAASAPFRTIIVGKSTYRFGCAFDSWSYVSSGAFGNRTITHEAGHMLGELYDEYASAALLNTNYVAANGQLDERNCSTKASPHWTPLSLPGVTNSPACALYGQGIRHPFASCLMGGSHFNLCEVCRRSLTDEIKYLRKQAEQPMTPVTPTPPTSLRVKGAGLLVQPPQPAPPPPPQPGEQPMVRLVIGITRASNALIVRRATNVTGRHIPDYRRLGPMAYEVSEGGKPLAYGFLRGDPFQVRDYRGGSPQHEIKQADTANFIVSIPGETVQRILAANRNLELSVYRVDPSVTAAIIPPQAFQELKAKKLATTLSQLVPAELRKMLM